jgi:hypothetical protein
MGRHTWADKFKREPGHPGGGAPMRQPKAPGVVGGSTPVDECLTPSTPVHRHPLPPLGRGARGLSTSSMTQTPPLSRQGPTGLPAKEKRFTISLTSGSGSPWGRQCKSRGGGLSSIPTSKQISNAVQVPPTVIAQITPGRQYNGHLSINICVKQQEYLLGLSLHGWSTTSE